MQFRDVIDRMRQDKDIISLACVSEFLHDVSRFERLTGARSLCNCVSRVDNVLLDGDPRVSASSPSLCAKRIHRTLSLHLQWHQRVCGMNNSQGCHELRISVNL